MCRDRSPLERAVDFHGHICPGLLIGVRAAEFAMKYLEVEPAYDEELMAVVENDSCAVDAIQAILGCTFGKGNLVFKDYGKQVYTIASRASGRAVRIAAKLGARETPANIRFRELNHQESLTQEEEDEKENLREVLFEEIMTRPFEELYEYREVDFQFPSRARVHATVCCDACGEGVMETRATQTGQGTLCPECIPAMRGDLRV